MFKLFVDPGHGGHDPGAVKQGIEEEDFTLDICLRIRRIVLEEYTGVEVKMSRTGDTYPTLWERSRMANDWGADFFLSIHINAGGGDGFESFRYSKAMSKTVSIQKTLHAHIVKAMGWKDRGMKTSGELYVLKNTKMPAVLTENLFIDNPSNVEQLKQETVREKCARAHVEGMAKAFGWTRKPVQTPPKPGAPDKPGTPAKPAPSGLWIVQCGAFKEKKHADALAERLRKAGFAAYVYQRK